MVFSRFRAGIALRTVWSEPGASPYLASLALLRVKSVREFRSHLARWRLPAVNFVAADRDGSIGWFVAGAIPKRVDGFGLIPRKISEDPWPLFLTAHLCHPDRSAAKASEVEGPAVQRPANKSGHGLTQVARIRSIRADQRNPWPFDF